MPVDETRFIPMPARAGDDSAYANFLAFALCVELDFGDRPLESNAKFNVDCNH